MGPICNYTYNKLLSSWAQNIPCPLVHHILSNSIVPIAHLSYDAPLHTYFSPHFPCKPQTTHQVPSYFNKPHTTYQFPLLAANLSCKCGAPILHFPNPLDNAQVGPFPPSILSTLIIVHDWAFQHICNLHVKAFAPLVGINILIEGWIAINILVKHPIHLVQTFMTISAQYPPLFPPRVHQLRLGFCHWMSPVPII